MDKEYRKILNKAKRTREKIEIEDKKLDVLNSELDLYESRPYDITTFNDLSIIESLKKEVEKQDNLVSNLKWKLSDIENEIEAYEKEHMPFVR